MLKRYSRQIILSNIGEKGQKKLLNSKAVIIGCGALGTVAANNLARAGVGNIVIVDRDFVELSNLQRQMLFSEEDVGEPKAISAAKNLKIVNSQINLDAVVADLNHTNVQELLKDADVVLDATDNIQTRMLVNDVCIMEEIPWIYTGAIGTSGMIMTILPSGPCLRCLYPNIPKPGSLPTCDTLGVLNTATMIMGSMESTEAIKILLGEYDGEKILDGTLVVYDAWNNSIDHIVVKKADECVCCTKGEFEFLNADEKEIITSLCGRNAMQITPASPKKIKLLELASKLENLGEVKATDFLVLFKIDDYEISIFRDSRAIIKGTSDGNVAKSLYARYIGT
ncbi:ThiF family adenylyltransferase [Methanobacterium alcaliphilum]|uniref:ThiF family adenylyltransferase n=1 Tax=Methanobacterium alcaliphilum TaxID=392018 RepID=UPI00200B7BEC|nr:ThiF family adenylyltransferase [Methanobacterium alcaliphilum]MCK9150706.1 ThiF family adenylyltransferase [Methanobacterium alcaliphilum]